MARKQGRPVASGFWRRNAAFVCGVIAGLVALAAMFVIRPRYAVPLAADVMFATYLLIVIFEFPRLTAEFLARRPDDVDSPVVVIFGFTIVVAVVAIGSLFLTLNSPDAADYLEIVLGVISVLLGWFTVHTMAALHYAHQYYLDADADAEGEVVGGLDFPGGQPPDGGAFLYFSYVLGMTAQVADVAVSSARMRRLVTLHGVFAFFFNTIIVAATVNVVVAVAGG